jgi:predicted SAM-dependent methyltransferase
LGCGPLIVDGYVNVDNDLSWISKDMKRGFLYGVSGKPDTFVLSCDLSTGVPAQKESIETIYHCHLLEHFTAAHGKTFLRDCHRCLVPGGTLRLAVPDFGLWCGNYVSENDEFFDWYRESYLQSNKAAYPTRASVFMGMMYKWGHKMSYDWDTVLAILSELVPGLTIE